MRVHKRRGHILILRHVVAPYNRRASPLVVHGREEVGLRVGPPQAAHGAVVHRVVVVVAEFGHAGPSRVPRVLLVRVLGRQQVRLGDALVPIPPLVGGVYAALLHCGER